MDVYTKNWRVRKQSAILRSQNFEMQENLYVNSKATVKKFKKFMIYRRWEVGGGGGGALQCVGILCSVEYCRRDQKLSRQSR
jgi:hypothetical protein